MKKTKILMASLTVATLAIGCGALVACGGDKPTPPPPSGDTYEITFDANGGTYAEGATTVKLITDENGRLAAAPTQTPTYEGYSFTTYYNTAEDGSGTTITYGVSGYQFTEDTTVYAQWDEIKEVAAGLYTVDGTLIAELEESTPDDSATKQYGSPAVPLAPGTVFQIKIGGETLTHTSELGLWTASGCHGINFNQSAATFTVKPGNERNFELYAKYYEDAPCWSVYVTDNLPDTLVPGGAYLVGGKGWENANWDISADNYIDPNNGLKVTLTSDAEFKITDCLDVATGENRGWAYNSASYYKMATGKEDGYLNFSSINASNGGSVLAAGEYTITIEGEGADIKFVFTPDESVKPNTSVSEKVYDYYLKGDFAKTGNWTQQSTKFTADPENKGVYTFSMYIKAGVQFGIVVAPEGATNQVDWLGSNLTLAGVVDGEVTKPGDLLTNKPGTYTFKLNPTAKTLDVEFVLDENAEPEPEYIIHYYIKGSMYANNWSMPGDEEQYKMTESTTEEGTVYTLTMHIDAGKEFMFYSKKEHPDTHEVSNASENIKANKLADAAKAYVGGEGDANMSAKASGTYTFTFDGTTLTVSFVADAPAGGGETT